jgi:hypothetical protein
MVALKVTAEEGGGEWQWTERERVPQIEGGEEAEERKNSGPPRRKAR